MKDIDEKIADWLEAKSKLQFYKQQELQLRKEIGEHFNINKLNEGTNHRQTDGFMIEIKRNFSYKVDQETLDEIYDELSDAEKACLKTTTSLLKSKYNDILDSSMLDDAIIVDDALLNIKATAI